MSQRQLRGANQRGHNECFGADCDREHLVITAKQRHVGWRKTIQTIYHIG